MSTMTADQEIGERAAEQVRGILRQDPLHQMAYTHSILLTLSYILMGTSYALQKYYNTEAILEGIETRDRKLFGRPPGRYNYAVNMLGDGYIISLWAGPKGKPPPGHALVPHHQHKLVRIVGMHNLENKPRWRIIDGILVDDTGEFPALYWETEYLNV